jgi:putative peptidoglycan lipid II flippase
LHLLIPTSLSLGVGYLGGVIDVGFASRAPEASALPAVVNAWLLVALPVRLIGYAVGQAVFPRLVAAAAEPGGDHLRRLATRTVGAAFLLAIPAGVGLVALARPVVRVLFEHGEFDADAASLTARLVVLYALVLPAYAATEVLTRGLIALRDTRTPLVTNTLQLGLRVAIATAFLDRLGVEVIPVAFAVSSVVEAVILAAVLRGRVKHVTKLLS